MNFSEIYLEELTKERTNNPQDYSWPIENIPIVHAKMMAAIKKGEANLNSPAIARTCRALNIKKTYKGLKEYFAL